ncbi:cytochrome c oxidase subunit 6b [Holotrichia oblita]|uniref:Cytochrome c oxidase subunit 6b n=1 Tax=Holotrichia oblita TaxID=644536 RepID=A0ACB9TB81_HOLOL|nr:cytochrome c oxidase subunit 6b [Holotrichia oblita]
MSEENEPPTPEEPENLPETIPIDPRFPNTNQTRYCYVMFADYHRCIQLFDAEHADCKYFQRAYKAVCPNFWIEKWEGQINDGIFPYPLPKDKKSDTKK